jgi:hypothetical protein
MQYPGFSGHLWLPRPQTRWVSAAGRAEIYPRTRISKLWITWPLACIGVPVVLIALLYPKLHSPPTVLLYLCLLSTEQDNWYSFLFD